MDFILTIKINQKKTVLNCFAPFKIWNILLIIFCVLDTAAQTSPIIAAGASHSLIMCIDGTIQSWGGDAQGQLGNNADFTDQPTPVAVSPSWGGSISTVSAGGWHTLALDNTGNVWSWGRDNHGQLGNNSAFTDLSLPVAVANLTGITAIAAGGQHSLALDNTGKVWAWGYDNFYGQVGDDAALVDQPMPVAVASITNITAIAAGSGHSLALDNTGNVWAWGYDAWGQLGNDILGTTQPMPVAVASITGITAIAAGGQHSLALKNDGTVWAWGYDQYGQLGDNASYGTASDSKYTPVPVAGLTGIIAISAGSNFSLALDNTGKVWSWGWDVVGELGNDVALVHQPLPVAVASITGIIAISAGSNHSLALDNAGKLWAWGYDQRGQLGDDGALVNQHMPVMVSSLICATILPIELLSFKGKNQGTTNLLEWKTATEINNDYFTLERSEDGNNFESIGVVDGAGNSTTELNYSFTDSHISHLTSHVFYYRLKQTDFNGDYTYSQTIAIAIPGIDIVSIYPNPSSDYFQYAISCSDETVVNVHVMDVLGKRVIEKNIAVTQGLNTNKLDVSTISNGTYILQVITNKGIYKAQKQFSVK